MNLRYQRNVKAAILLDEIDCAEMDEALKVALDLSEKALASTPPADGPAINQLLRSRNILTQLHSAVGKRGRS
jgi:hypothetical protein